MTVRNICINLVSSILLVPDTEYSKHVPVIIGTNILKRLMQQVEDDFGERFKHTAKLPDAGLCCMKVQSREVHRAKGKLAVVKCSSHPKIVIPGNTTTEIMGRIDKRVSSAEHLDGSSLPDGVN